MKIKLNKKETYESLIKQYGVPETDRWGIRTFEYTNDGTGQPYQFVIEAKTKKPIEKKMTKCLGQQGGLYFYRKKNKSVLVTDVFSPSMWEGR